MQHSAQKKGEVGLLDEGSKKTLRGRQVPNALAQQGQEIVLTVRARVGQRAFQVPPDALVGIKFGRVRRKGFQMQPPEALAQCVDGSALVYGGIVEKNDDVSAKVLQEVAKKHGDLVAADVDGVEMAVQAQTMSLGADRNARDRRNSVMAMPMAKQRRLTARAPRFPHGRNQQKSGFVRENDVGTQPCGVFFTRGHTVRFHWAIRVSSRSMARRSGFWWLHPNRCRSLPTWLR